MKCALGFGGITLGFMAASLGVVTMAVGIRRPPKDQSSLSLKGASCSYGRQDSPKAPACGKNPRSPRIVPQ